MTRVLVTGAAGFIGYHLVGRLKAHGYWVRGVDLKHPPFGPSPADEFYRADLRLPDACVRAVRNVDEVYALAADMGGIGYISRTHAALFHSNALINLHTLDAAARHGVRRYLLTSSACIYPEYLQTDARTSSLKETDAYPAAPQDAYGWEKLMAERALQYYSGEYDMETCAARMHNIYGPYGTYKGGREKAPAAICRKVALASDGQDIEVWGDGLQTRSFCYIDDCVEGLYRLMRSRQSDPLNIGSDRLVTINELADVIVRISGKRNLTLRHVQGPQGVRGRNSDNTRMRAVLDWEPSTSLEDGLQRTYRWIDMMVNNR